MKTRRSTTNCTVSEGHPRWREEADLHPEAISRQAAVSLATAVGAAQRLDYLYQHGQSKAVGAEARALFLFTMEDESVQTQLLINSEKGCKDTI